MYMSISYDSNFGIIAQIEHETLASAMKELSMANILGTYQMEIWELDVFKKWHVIISVDNFLVDLHR